MDARLMIRKNIYQALLVVTVAITVIIFVSESIYQTQSKENTEKQLAQLSVIHSQVVLQIAQVDWSEAKARSVLLEKLHRIQELDEVEIKTKDKESITTLSSTVQNTTQNSRLFNQYYSLYLPKIKDVQVNDILFFRISLPNYPIQLITSELILILVFLGFGLMLFFLRQFKWVEQLEQYASHVLTSEANRPLDVKQSSSNIIAHAMNQLILNNSHMIKDKIELAEKVRKTSYIDEVTELGNHLFFKAELEVRLHNHDEAESGLVAILSFIDADTKDDQALTGEQQIEIANILKLFADEIEHSVVARLKNSEYALLLPYLTGDQIDSFCKKLIQQLGKTVFDKLHRRAHFIDIGLSNYKQGFGYYNIMSEADMALRNAQLQGANSWFVYGEPLPKDKSKGSLRWRNFLHNILDRREIMLYSQRIHYFSDNALLHREVLSRVSDDSQVISASRFLVMANQCGLSTEFDRQIVDEVIKYILHQDESIIEQKYSINLFISSLLDSQFTSWLIGKLSSYPQLNRKLFFEISENHITKSIDQVAPVMRQLSELGISWSIEHFGSPEQNLNYLNKAPFSMVKIDRRIINNICADKDQQLLLSSIIVSLRSRNIAIFAEGVEKKLDADYLKGLEIDGAQGYYFDKPRKLELPEKSLKAI